MASANVQLSCSDTESSASDTETTSFKHISFLRKASEEDEVIVCLMQQIGRGWPDSKLSCNPLIVDYWDLRHELTVQDGQVYYQGKILIPSISKAHITSRLDRDFLSSIQSNDRLCSLLINCVYFGWSNSKQRSHPLVVEYWDLKDQFYIQDAVLFFGQNAMLPARLSPDSIRNINSSKVVPRPESATDLKGINVNRKKSIKKCLSYSSDSSDSSDLEKCLESKAAAKVGRKKRTYGNQHLKRARSDSEPDSMRKRPKWSDFSDDEDDPSFLGMVLCPSCPNMILNSEVTLNAHLDICLAREEPIVLP